MKKALVLLLSLAFVLTLTACSYKDKLYVLNWGDYMDESLIKQFEKEYRIDVKYKPVGSNEDMASLLIAQNAVYDLVFPSDYMIDKFIQDEMIQPIDFSLLTHFDELELNPTLASLYAESGFSDYVVPYAWGTIGIMYRTDKVGLQDFVESEGWAALFESGSTYRAGMYDSSRDAVAAALLYLGYSVNSEDGDELEQAENALRDANFHAWGEDNLKGRILANTLDLALVYSGDYFSEYYAAIEDGRAINFGFYVPESTNVWMDAIVIPNIAQNITSAHLFIDFFLREEVALQNYEWIGYAPPYITIYDQIYDQILSDFGGLASTFDPYPQGSLREMYVYGSNERATELAHILARVKPNL
jgi:spermidine/putrescine-binding protein